MKVSLSASLKDELLNPRFGRCEVFKVYDTDTKEIKVIENPGASCSGGAGIKAANFLIDEKADVLITGHLGPNAMGVLKNSNILLYTSGAKSIDEVLKDYKDNKLEKMVK